jgi:hypothetical protein
MSYTRDTPLGTRRSRRPGGEHPKLGFTVRCAEHFPPISNGTSPTSYVPRTTTIGTLLLQPAPDLFVADHKDGDHAADYLDTSSTVQPQSQRITSTIFHFGKAKYYFQFNTLQRYFSSIVSDSPCLRDLRRPTLHAFSCSFSPPPRHARGLGVADLHARGLGFANLRVVRPEGLN